MNKILLPIGDAAETMDTLYAYYRIREAGYQVVVAGPEKRIYAMVLHEIPPGWHITRETPGYHLAADIAFADIREHEFAGIFLTGGRAPEYIRYDENLLRAVRHCFAAGKPVCSVCHGAEIVAAADVIRGRRMATVAKCSTSNSPVVSTSMKAACATRISSAAGPGTISISTCPSS
jgi:protease I